MPNGRLNWLDRAAEVGNDLGVGLIEEIMDVAPEVDALFARNIGEATEYDTAVRIGLPTVGWRSLNQGIPATKSKIDKRSVKTHIMAGRVEIDKQAYKAAKKIGETDLDVEAVEASGVAQAAKLHLGSQLVYGTGLDKGFVGLKNLVVAGAEGAITVDAEGTTANTATSIYAVKTGLKDVALVLGGGVAGLDLDEFRDETLYDENGLPYPGRVADLQGWIGLQVPHANCVGRIYNLTAENGKGANDDILSELFSKFPTGSKPDFYLMSRRSARQLQKSRAVVINVGGGNKASGSVASTAPMPTETADGIPIIVTDSIKDTDAIEVVA